MPPGHHLTAPDEPSEGSGSLNEHKMLHSTASNDPEALDM